MSSLTDKNNNNNNNQNSPLHQLSPNVVVLPPKRSHTPYKPEYNDLVAIDIALLPNNVISQHIIEHLNKPLRTLSQLVLDESHFPHMSLLHTIVHIENIPLICQILQMIVNNPQIDVLSILTSWLHKVENNTHPFYTTQSSSNYSNDIAVLKEYPYYHISTTFSTTSNGVSNNGIWNVVQSLLFTDDNNSNNNNQKSNLNVLPHTFTYNKGWPGPRSSPYVGYPNPVLLTKQLVEDNNNNENIVSPMSNGLNVRLLHDIVTTIFSIFRVDIPEVHEILQRRAQQQDKKALLSSTEQDDQKNKTNTNTPQPLNSQQEDEILYNIAQQVYFTGDTIYPSCIISNSTQQSLYSESPQHALEFHITKQPIIPDNISYTHDLTVLAAHPIQQSQSSNNNSHSEAVNSECLQQQNESPCSNNDNQISSSSSPTSHETYIKTDIIQSNTSHTPQTLSIFSSAQPFDKEAALADDLLYTSQFDLKSRGEKYNPHITVGYGPADKVKVVFDDIFNISDELQKNQYNPQTGAYHFLDESIFNNIDLRECTIGVFQLGFCGSCRWPIFKTQLNIPNDEFTVADKQ